MKKLIATSIMAMLLMSSIGFAQVETYDKTFTRDLTDPELGFVDESGYDLVNYCHLIETDPQAIIDAGGCERVHFCGLALPKTSLSFYDSVATDCKEVTDVKNPPSVRIRFTPARGMRYAVTTLVIVEYQIPVMNPDGSFSGTWQKDIVMPESLRMVEEVIGFCPVGQMMRSNMCFDAQGICLDPQSTNMCLNEYEMYCLAYRYDENGDPIFECDTHPEYACADRNLNGVCDTVTSVICSDLNNNGICDEDDLLIQSSSCIDANQNGVCDNVETEGVFCTKDWDPVCIGGAGGTTYPNPCFAEGAGYLESNWIPGECDPITLVRQCESPSDCPIPARCLHLSATCIDYQCNYAGNCEQCQQTSDCPEPPCVGVAVQCSAEGLCEYAGKCLTEPKKLGIIELILALFGEIWLWILGQLGWL